ncbi:hypothetical protein NKH57_15835 [Mesorhizobium sp. M1050]|uniref:hypothetical protein n=1 Tax=Mesorhizobium sp. M1050 TaxID=2957051 RepID=UPI003339ACB4
MEIAIIGPYRDEAEFLWALALGSIAGAGAGGLAWLSGVAVHAINPLAAGLSATAMAGAVFGGLAGGLLGTFTTSSAKTNDASMAEGIILVTAHVDENEIDAAQAVLGDESAKFVAEAA